MSPPVPHTDILINDPSFHDALKKKHLKIHIAEKSQLPYRVMRKKNGVVLASFETREGADQFIDKTSLTTLGIKL